MNFNDLEFQANETVLCANKEQLSNFQISRQRLCSSYSIFGKSLYIINSDYHADICKDHDNPTGSSEYLVFSASVVLYCWAILEYYKV